VLGEQKIPLVHWRTTIGSWRSEMYNGSEHYKYKESDVGDRVWKEIVAAPVWIPPATTPPRELVRRKWKDGKVRTVVNYGEFGPSYTSAYGLVAAYHIKEIKDADGTWKADFDNGIRTHGSVDYMSILRRFSHGCHRLYNMSAVRMFSFILAHRELHPRGPDQAGLRPRDRPRGQALQDPAQDPRLSLQPQRADRRARARGPHPRRPQVARRFLHPQADPGPAPGDQLTPESSPEATAPDVTPMTPVAPASP
jgi:hypothetical protein